jgi:hypothetical protein
METKKPQINIQKVKSSNLIGIGYDDKSETLAVQFKSGTTYHYSGVSRDQYEALKAAESVGKMYHANIRGKFEGEKI